jgi:superfamily II DNA/RNA helicase
MMKKKRKMKKKMMMKKEKMMKKGKIKKIILSFIILILCPVISGPNCNSTCRFSIISKDKFLEPIIDLLYTHYQRPTVIQAISWPVALSGRDQISIAKTGSGKTLGFILPAIVHTLSQPKRRPGEGPSVLVLLPTRELAIQVEEVAREYCNSMRLELTCCYGGAPKTNQANDLRKGLHHF